MSVRFRLVRGVALADEIGGACEQQVKDELSVTQDIDRQNAAARPDLTVSTAASEPEPVPQA